MSIRGSDINQPNSTAGSSTNYGSTSAMNRHDSGIRTRLNASSRPYKELLIGGLAAAVVGCIIVSILLDRFYMEWPNLVLVCVCMMAMALPIILVCGLIEAKMIGLAEKSRAMDVPRALLFALAGTLIIGAAALALEFLYELGYAYQGVNYDDYIFVIDDSGSMGSNDRGNKRYSALESLLNGMDETNMVGVIRFSDIIEGEEAPDVLNDSHRQNIQNLIGGKVLSGSTDIQLALNRAIEMFQTAKRDRPSAIVLLSDGQSLVDVNGLTAQANAMDVDICTVALGMGADRQMLQSLADSTGGMMMDVRDADMLRVSYKLLNGGVLRRCLLMPRIGSDRGDILHGIMSVVFMGVLGSLISLALVLMFGTSKAQPQLVIGTAASFAGALIHELGNAIGTDGIARTAMLILFGLVLLQFYGYSYDLDRGKVAGRKARKTIRGDDTRTVGRPPVTGPDPTQVIHTTNETTHGRRRGE